MIDNAYNIIYNVGTICIKEVNIMAQKNMNIRIDEELKNQADAILSDMGLNMSVAVNMYLKQIVRTREIPFIISAKNPINNETLKSMEDTEKGLHLTGPFNNVSDLMRSLDE